MKLRTRSSLLSLLAILIASSAHAQPPKIRNAAEIELALEKLRVVGTALYIAAHPDDENTAMLSWLANERLVRTGYLSITRGDGGQNLIGTEQGELLGVIRTEELLAARRIDGAEQFFTRAIDFGYTKTPAEALSRWGHDRVLADVVWAIRKFRPDIIITRFPTNGDGGHGQHTASAILAVEAFAAAADPKQFPEQLELVKPWQAKRLLWNAWRPELEKRTPEMPKLLPVDLGAYNALLGRSYTELAGESRSMHKSQGFGAPERRGSIMNYLEHVAGEAPATDLFDGVELTWKRIPGGDPIAKTLDDVVAAYDPRDPSKSLPLLLRAHGQMQRLADDPLVRQKKEALLDIVRSAAGLWIEAIAATPAVTPGDEIAIKATVINRSSYPFQLDYIWLPLGQRLDRDVTAPLPQNKPVTNELTTQIPSETATTQPYWLQAPHDGGSFSVRSQELIGSAHNPPALQLRFVLRADEEVLMYDAPVQYRWTDRVRGELYRPVEITPPVTANLNGAVYVFPDRKSKKIRVTLKAGKPLLSGTVRLTVPSTWKVDPSEIAFKLARMGDESPAVFTITPPETEEAVLVGVETSITGAALGEEIIDYSHIPMQSLFPSAVAKLVRVDVSRIGSEIGYVAGSGDSGPEALRQIGYRVTLLSDEDLESGDLSRYDAIVTGIRAYNARERLKELSKRLVDYVEKGGTLVAQYNTVDDTLQPEIGPYPFKLSRDRVVHEDAPVAMPDPNHPILTSPNRIRPSDFDHWIQERGLYFASEWDPRYQTPLESHDPGEPERKGGTLYARHGKGVFIYSSYAWFRQLPNGVPGAYRLFANLVSARGSEK